MTVNIQVRAFSSNKLQLFSYTILEDYLPTLYTQREIRNKGAVYHLFVRPSSIHSVFLVCLFGSGSRKLHENISKTRGRWLAVKAGNWSSTRNSWVKVARHFFGCVMALRKQDHVIVGEDKEERIVCWLVAYRPSNRLVYLRDGSAQTILRAATLR